MVTAQGSPGSVLEWEEDGDKTIVRRAGRFRSNDIHEALFGARKLETHSFGELKDGIRRYVLKRYPPSIGFIPAVRDASR